MKTQRKEKVSKMIVVASYKDDLSFLENKWLQDIPRTIYEKGKGDNWKQQILDDSKLTMKDFIEVDGDTVYLPNIGQDGQVFLHHIVENYDNLSDINVFIAGDALEDLRHRDNTPAYYYNMISSFDKNSPQYVNVAETTGNFPLRGFHYRFFNDRIRDKWKDLFEEECPTKFEPAIDSTFMATKEAILSHPKSFYEKALSWIDERCYREDHWKMEWQGDVVSVLAPSKKNLEKFPHKSPKHFEFPACGFFEHSYQRMFDPNFRQCIKIK